MAESDIQKSIIDYLTIKKVFFWRQNSGAVVTESKRFIRMGITGAPDIFIVKNGQIIGLEIKTLKGRQNENQKNFQEMFEKAGGIYYLVRSLDDVIKVIHN